VLFVAAAVCLIATRALATAGTGTAEHAGYVMFGRLCGRMLGLAGLIVVALKCVSEASDHFPQRVASLEANHTCQITLGKRPALHIWRRRARTRDCGISGPWPGDGGDLPVV
jgi:hypothetical protein